MPDGYQLRHPANTIHHRNHNFQSIDLHPHSHNLEHHQNDHGDRNFDGWEVRLEHVDPDTTTLGVTSPCLAKVDETITFKATANGEYSCLLHIQNIAQGNNKIIFKIKTTSPHSYTVKPTIAVIEPGGSAKVPMIAAVGVSAEQIQRDRFQVQVCVLPKDVVNYESAESVTSSTESLVNDADLSMTFKKLISSTPVDTCNVTVTAEPRPTVMTVPGASTLCMTEEKLRKGLEDLERKISDSVSRRIQSRIDGIQKLVIIILMVLIVLLVIVVVQWIRQVHSKCVCPEATKGDCWK